MPNCKNTALPVDVQAPCFECNVRTKNGSCHGWCSNYKQYLVDIGKAREERKTHGGMSDFIIFSSVKKYY